MQKSMLEEYATKNGFTNIKHFVDDGYTGGNFDRPQWNASHRARSMSGKRLTFNPIYGYVLDPNDKSKWIIDPESAEVVQRIFQLTIEGKAPCDIHLSSKNTI